MKKTIVALLCLLLVSVCAFALADVVIDESHFPDEVFREYVKDFDADGNGSLNEEEIQSVSLIVVYDAGVKDLKGVEYFTALTELNCSFNQLTSLDVSRNTALKGLYCQGNEELDALDISHNTELQYLDCGWSKIKTLDTSRCPSLSSYSCFFSRLSSVDVSMNPELVYLHVEANELKSLDVSHNPKLETLYCNNNKLKSLKLGRQNNLSSFSCMDNPLKSINISKCPMLEKMALSGEKARQNPHEARDFFGWWEPEKYVGWPDQCLYISEGLKIVTSRGIIDTAYPATGITLDPARTVLTREAEKLRPTVKLNAVVEPAAAAGIPLMWTSSNEKVAKVDGNGKVTALKAGKAVITCTAIDGSGFSASCKLTVKDTLVSSILLRKKTVTLAAGKKFLIKIRSIKPAAAVNKNVKWTSGNRKIATVDQNGRVTAKAPGTCIITCTAKDGSKVFATCRIIVK